MYFDIVKNRSHLFNSDCGFQLKEVHVRGARSACDCCILVFTICKLSAGAPLGACRTLGEAATRVTMAYQSYSSLSRAQLTFEYLHTNS